MIKKQNEAYYVKGNTYFLMMTAVACFMLFFSLPELFDIYREAGSDPSNTVGAVFLTVWSLLVLGLGLFSFSFAMRKFVISSSGISYTTPFRKVNFDYREIRDYGITAYGSIRGGGTLYAVYFSTDELPVKKKNKKLTHRTATVVITDRERVMMLKEVFPFCQEKIDRPPYLS
ncbi:MAG: hypothetical protein IJW46_06005 [Clostridia bacterium]|nr:hypothetical protein [Clostridia bacterium]